jgi:hypothetical protein
MAKKENDKAVAEFKEVLRLAPENEQGKEAKAALDRSGSTGPSVDEAQPDQAEQTVFIISWQGHEPLRFDSLGNIVGEPLVLAYRKHAEVDAIVLEWTLTAQLKEPRQGKRFTKFTWLCEDDHGCHAPQGVIRCPHSAGLLMLVMMEHSTLSGSGRAVIRAGKRRENQGFEVMSNACTIPVTFR